jgi:Spermine/spermidine synthase domain
MDVYDVLRPGVQSLELYKKSLLNDGSYEAENTELFAPDRILFLDGVMQSRRSGDAAYHGKSIQPVVCFQPVSRLKSQSTSFSTVTESLVHPAMFAHKNPKRVAIVGGGEGATLREVLKHSTIEKVVMIDIDEDMVTLSREFLPFSSDCSNIKNSNKSCFDDPRVETYYEDAFQWFMDRFSVEEGNRQNYDEKPFDVIIVDAL